MATLGLCAYCQRPAARTCKMCGKAICKEHAALDNVTACNQCAQGNVMG